MFCCTLLARHGWRQVFLSPVDLIVADHKVVKIADGDTLTLLVSNEQHKIRLSDIDTPERKQPFGTRAKGCYFLIRIRGFPASSR